MIYTSISGDMYRFSYTPVQECSLFDNHKVIMSCFCPAWANPFAITDVMRTLYEARKDIHLR